MGDDQTLFADLRIIDSSFQLSAPTQIARTAGGAVYTAGLGAALWTGTVRLKPAYHSAAVAVEAALSRLQRPGQRMLLWDRRRIGPAADPSGALLGAATPSIHSSGGNWIRIKGLPPGYVIRRGDMIGWTHGPGQLWRILHRAWTPEVVTDGAGITPQIEVEPLVRPAVAANDPVTLVQPSLIAVLTGIDNGTGRSVVTEGASFQWVQALR